MGERKGSLYDVGGGGSPRRLLEFPFDDVEVRTIPREQPTVESPIPPEINVEELNAHCRDMLTNFESNLVIVQRKNEQYSMGEAHYKQTMERQILSQTIPRQKYEVDLQEEISHRPQSFTE